MKYFILALIATASISHANEGKCTFSVSVESADDKSGPLPNLVTSNDGAQFTNYTQFPVSFDATRGYPTVFKSYTVQLGEVLSPWLIFVNIRRVKGASEYHLSTSILRNETEAIGPVQHTSIAEKDFELLSRIKMNQQGFLVSAQTSCTIKNE